MKSEYAPPACPGVFTPGKRTASGPAFGLNTLPSEPFATIKAPVICRVISEFAISFTLSPAELYAVISSMYGYGGRVGVMLGVPVEVGESVYVHVAVSVGV